MVKYLKNKVKSIFGYFKYVVFNVFRLKKANVLMYHSVGEECVLFNVSPDVFEKQISFLVRKNYNIISLKKLVDILESGNTIPKRTTVITFDDAYKNNFEYVLPVLKRYNISASIFLPTNLVGKSLENSSSGSLDILNWDEIIEMHKTGLVDFYSHTANHKKLTKIDASACKKELFDSKKVLEEKLGVNCEYMAFPKGKYNQEIITIAKNIGYKALLTTSEGRVDLKTELNQVPRRAILSDTNWWQFLGKIS